MKKTLNAFAAAVLLGSTAIAPFAHAQDATAPAAGTQAPATGTEAPAVAPMTDTAPAATNSTMAATTDTYLTEQSASQISANNFIGQSVYTSGDDSIGEINDLIIEEKGGIVAAVIGVGGFLGIGEKDVAVPMSKITVTRDADDADELRLTTMETAETLKAAPEFKKLDARADASSTMVPTDNTTTSSTVTK
ncbi:photosystem reaction center subunit H [Rhizobium sp. KAs_5_22]|uniref:PRC-barrel domain-containing protein n=1 Tax=Ciceribacter selenitireducens TaxID=448181 RepID=UPI0004910C23|nr:PRC-barrel domain-containing protein [Ciceribacter selenitireducens]PPJ47612.1 photosystem reaction center subunit H [Rhizobium sp. KAs_5_22]